MTFCGFKEILQFLQAFWNASFCIDLLQFASFSPLAQVVAELCNNSCHLVILYQFASFHIILSNFTVRYFAKFCSILQDFLWMLEFGKLSAHLQFAKNKCYLKAESIYLQS